MGDRRTHNTQAVRRSANGKAFGGRVLMEKAEWVRKDEIGPFRWWMRTAEIGVIAGEQKLSRRTFRSELSGMTR